MADNPYAPSPLGGAQPSVAPSTVSTYMPPATLAPSAPAAAPTGPYHPSEINTALVNAGVPPAVAPTLTAVSGAESGFGRSAISPPNKDGSRDHGVFQVNDKAWPQFKNVAAQPLQTQAAIAAHIYNQQGLKAWSTYNNGAYKKYLNGAPSATSGAPAAPSTATPAAPVATSPYQDFAAAYQSGNVGGMLAALNKGQGTDGQGKSAIDNLAATQSAAEKGAMQGAAQSSPQMAPPPMPIDTSMPAQQLFGQVLAQQAKPLSWSRTPFGSNAGPQVPGTTLNSV